MRFSKNKKIILKALGIIIMIISLAVLASCAKRDVNIKDFDSKSIAAVETKMWQAYYDKHYYTLFFYTLETLSQQFKLSMTSSVVAGYHATKAAKAFSEYPSDTPHKLYDKNVLPHLVSLFEVIKKSTKSDWDPELIARAELDWWVARRTENLNESKIVGQAISHAYSLLYGKTNFLIDKAGLLRAEAAALRDKQANKGKVNWPQIQKLLEQSYRALLLGLSIQ